MNWNIFASDTPVLIQGITGKEGMRMALWLIQSGVNIVGGVTPGKGGQMVENRPVFHSVLEAKTMFPDLETSCIVVPSSRVLGAVQEAVEAGIKYITILTEQVPIHDVLIMRKLSEEHGVGILGPSSVGYLQFPAFRLGYLGGDNPFRFLKEGGFAIVSTSGGMTNELMMSLAGRGIGLRLACAIGGDRLTGILLEEAVAWSESQESVHALAVFAEPGQPWLSRVCSGAIVLHKPTVVFLAGEALDDLPRGVPYGHTGTLLGEDDLSVHEMRVALRERGIVCVGTMSDFLLECQRYA